MQTTSARSRMATGLEKVQTVSALSGPGQFVPAPKLPDEKTLADEVDQTGRELELRHKLR